jgi:hypothetical protein
MFVIQRHAAMPVEALILYFIKPRSVRFLAPWRILWLRTQRTLMDS